VSSRFIEEKKVRLFYKCHVNLINDLLVQHVSATVDGAQTSESLRQLSQPVQRIQVRALSIPGK